MTKTKFYNGAKKVGAGFLICAQLVTFGIMSGCSTELSDDYDSLDILSSKIDENSVNDLYKGIEQIKKVDVEKFKLVINYKSLEEKWHINATKKLGIVFK